MATGYTCYIEDSPNPTFDQFLWRCAHAYVYDSSLSERIEIPEEYETDPYYTKQLADAYNRLDRAKKLTISNVKDEVKRRNEQAVEEWAKREKEWSALLTRYARMREQVEAWEIPTPEHKSLKDFMLSQIDDSVRWVGGPRPRPTPVTPKEYISNAIESALRDVQYYAEQIQDDIKKKKAWRDWLVALDKSVPQPDPE